MSDFLRLQGLEHARPPCPSPIPRVYSNSCPLSQWCHPNISSSVIPFSSCPQSFPASGSFQMSQFFESGGQETRKLELRELTTLPRIPNLANSKECVYPWFLSTFLTSHHAEGTLVTLMIDPYVRDDQTELRFRLSNFSKITLLAHDRNRIRNQMTVKNNLQVLPIFAAIFIHLKHAYYEHLVVTFF